MLEIEMSERTFLNFKCPECTTLESNLWIQVLSLTSEPAPNQLSCLEQVGRILVCKEEKSINELQYP